jgi:hypothetical protein
MAEIKPSVGCRLELEVVERLDSLRPLFPTADGRPTTRSAVLRGLIDGGFLLLDKSLLEEIDAVGDERPRREVFLSVVRAGLTALKGPVTDDRRRPLVICGVGCGNTNPRLCAGVNGDRCVGDDQCDCLCHG